VQLVRKQSVWPCGHAHLPATHAAPPEHTLLHIPQFQLSPVVSMQLPLQYVLSGVQRETHLLAAHIWSCGHMVLHPPQC